MIRLFVLTISVFVLVVAANELEVLRSEVAQRGARLESVHELCPFFDVAFEQMRQGVNPVLVNLNFPQDDNARIVFFTEAK